VVPFTEGEGVRKPFEAEKESLLVTGEKKEYTSLTCVGESKAGTFSRQKERKRSVFYLISLRGSGGRRSGGEGG